MKNLFLLFAFVFSFLLSTAQVPVVGENRAIVIDDDANLVQVSQNYQSFTSDKILMDFEIQSFKGWEIWLNPLSQVYYACRVSKKGRLNILSLGELKVYKFKSSMPAPGPVEFTILE